jgi:hypothetical protein
MTVGDELLADPRARLRRLGQSGVVVDIAPVPNTALRTQAGRFNSFSASPGLSDVSVGLASV